MLGLYSPTLHLFFLIKRGRNKMKKIIITSILTLLIGFQVPAIAIKLNGEEKTLSPVYKPTTSAVKKTMTKMGINFEVDEDGDLKYKLDDKNWTAYVIFNETSSGKLWNIQMIARFSTKKSRYDELVEYANSWNTSKKFPKISMEDKDTLRISMNYPVQYGFNPDEFEENMFYIFERTLKKIGDETEAMRK